MKTKKQYVFGYLFVRFAKAIAGLVLAVMLGACALHTFGLVNILNSLTYRANSELRDAFESLGSELDYVRKEAERFGYVDDGKTVEPGPVPTSCPEMALAETRLAAVRVKVIETKRGVTAEFVRKATDLRNRIRTTIEEIEKLRKTGDSRPVAPAASTSPPPIQLTTPKRISQEQIRTLFGTADRITNMRAREQLADYSMFFRNLHDKAEKPENKELINSLLTEFQKLNSLFPEVPGAEKATPDVPNVSAAPTVKQENGADAKEPEDPLVTAIANVEAIDAAIEGVVRLAQEKWEIDRLFSAAEQLLQRESGICMAQKTAAVAAWIEWSKQVGLALVIGLVAAFFILVFADFIQSFFDTSVNTRRTADLLDSKDSLPDR